LVNKAAEALDGNGQFGDIKFDGGHSRKMPPQRAERRLHVTRTDDVARLNNGAGLNESGAFSVARLAFLHDPCGTLPRYQVSLSTLAAMTADCGAISNYLGWLLLSFVPAQEGQVLPPFPKPTIS
jgi:hypothetical protein